MQIKQVRANIKRLDLLRNKTKINILDKKKTYKVDKLIAQVSQRVAQQSKSAKLGLPRKLSGKQIMQLKMQMIQSSNPVTMLGNNSNNLLQSISQYKYNMPTFK